MRAFVIAVTLGWSGVVLAHSALDTFERGLEARGPAGVVQESVWSNGNAPLTSSRRGHDSCRGANDPYVVNGRRYIPLGPGVPYDEEGTASWFGDEVKGKRTVCGERAKKNSMTASHTTLPLPSRVRVTNLESGRSVILRINDRGPFSTNRIISVSEKAARRLGFLEQRTARVRVERLDFGAKPPVPKTESQPAGIYLETETIFGAFNAFNTAEVLQNILGIPTQILELLREESYRIRIGPFDSLAAAERARATLIIKRQQELSVVVE